MRSLPTLAFALVPGDVRRSSHQEFASTSWNNVSMTEDLYGSVGASLSEGKVDVAAKINEDALRSCEAMRFGSLLTSGFANTPRSVLDHINGFLVACKNAFDVKAIYLPRSGYRSRSSTEYST